VSAAAPTLTVLIADDDVRIREALRDVLDAQPDLTVVALAADSEQAVALATRQHPDVAIIDVRMPGGGAAIAREVHDRSPDTRILAFSAHHDNGAIREMEQAGALEYVVKGAPIREIVSAVRRVGSAESPDGLVPDESDPDESAPDESAPDSQADQ
jgi:DNA-binding NarL/FixJ family response regulator